MRFGTSSDINRAPIICSTNEGNIYITFICQVHPGLKKNKNKVQFCFSCYTFIDYLSCFLNSPLDFG